MTGAGFIPRLLFLWLRALGVFELGRILDKAAGRRQNAALQFCHHELFIDSVLVREVVVAGPEEPKTSVVGRIAKDDDETNTLSPAEIQPLPNQAPPDASLLEFGDHGHRSESNAVGGVADQGDWTEENVSHGLSPDFGNQRNRGLSVGSKSGHQAGLCLGGKRPLMDVVDGRYIRFPFWPNRDRVERHIGFRNGDQSELR